MPPLPLLVIMESYQIACGYGRENLACVLQKSCVGFLCSAGALGLLLPNPLLFENQSYCMLRGKKSCFKSILTVSEEMLLSVMKNPSVT